MKTRLPLSFATSFVVLLLCYASAAFGRVAETETPQATLKSGAVWRSASATAKVSFVSDADGTLRYLVTASEEAPANLTTSGTVGGGMQANKLLTLTLSELAEGAQYVHAVVVPTDEAVVASAVRTVPMPYDVYYFDDFNAYTDGAYPQHFFQKYNGTGSANQKIITTVQSDGTEGGVFRLEGAGGWASEQRVLLPATTKGLVVWEADMKLRRNWGSLIIGQNNITWTGGIARIHPALNEATKLIVADGTIRGSYNIEWDTERWYRLRIETDLDLRKFSCYIDGVALNSEPVDAHPSYTLDYFELTGGHGGEAYYDNARFYIHDGVITGTKRPSETAEGATVHALPNGKSFVVDFGALQPERLEVYDLQGTLRLVRTAPSTPSATIDMSAYAGGVYLLKVSAKQGSKTFKIAVAP